MGEDAWMLNLDGFDLAERHRRRAAQCVVDLRHLIVCCINAQMSAWLACALTRAR